MVSKLPFFKCCFFSHMKALPIEFLRTPAESALVSLLKLRAGAPIIWEGISREILSIDAILVLSACEALQTSQHMDEIIIDDAIICASAKTLVESLSQTSLLKLSLVTWNFDASGLPSEELTHFLRQPNDNAVWGPVHRQYQRIAGKRLAFCDFKASFDFMLWSALGSVFNGV